MDLAGPWATVDTVPVDAYSPDGSPRARLNEARAAQITQQWSRRSAALAAASADPSLNDQVRAERAIDDAVDDRLDDAERGARELIASTHDEIARARALEALGRALLWRGTETAAREGTSLMLDAITYYEAIGSSEWLGGAQFWLGNAGCLQRGDLAAAEPLFRQALATLAPGSRRRTTVMTFLADLLIFTGRFDETEAVLAQALREAAADEKYQQAYIAWSHARLASVRGDRTATVRAVREVEHHMGDWFDITTGATFLGDAAAVLARVGAHELAQTYLQRAADRDPDDEFVVMAEAELLARDGDPEQALRALDLVATAEWLELVQVWRMTLLAAWACVRAGRITDATDYASRGFAQAEAVGGIALAGTNEPRLTAHLAPLAARNGSAAAARQLSSTSRVLLLLDTTALMHADEPVELPSGLAGALLRLVAIHDRGIDAEQAIDQLWPDADPATGRKLLRTTLSRITTRIDNLVVRDGPRLILNDTWVDLQAFRQRADLALSERDPDAVVAALAMWGEPLPDDRFADWAAGTRDQLVRRRLRLLDLAAELIPDRGEYYLELAIEADPDAPERYDLLAKRLEERGRPAAANRWRAAAPRRGSSK